MPTTLYALQHVAHRLVHTPLRLRFAAVQGDPWRDPQVAQLLHSNAMLFSLVGRDAPMRIQDEPHNRIWIVACFGTQVADALGPKGVSCSGERAACGGVRG